MTTSNPRRFRLSRKVSKQLKSLAGAFLIVGFTLLLLEGLLRLADPWGLYYFNDLLKFGNEIAIVDAERDFIMADGQHRFAYWTATIADGKRVIPANHPDMDCTIGLLGDSVLFGYGVSDNETAPQYLAQQFPSVNFLNLSMIGYNSQNVLANYRAFPDAEGYLYLIVGNDHDPTLSAEGDMFVSAGSEKLPHLVRYVQFMIYDQNNVDLENDPHINQGESPNMQRMLDDIDALTADGNVRLVTFDFYVTMIQLIEERGHDVTAIPYPSQTISVVDAHANASGNQELAASLAPIVQDIMQANCTN